MRKKDTKVSLFEDLHRQHYPMVFQMAMGFLKGDRSLAADLAQEVFINIWNSIEKFRGEAAFKTWIYRITVNTCLLHLRQASRKQIVPLEQDVILEMHETSKTASEQNAALYRAIGALPELDRIIIMLFLEELEYAEIAAITGISAVNLRVRMHRIKKKMHELLKLSNDE